jgi:hypothetical protein
MARPSKLTPAQWAEVERRIAEGEGLSAIAREFGVSKSTISGRVSGQTERVQKVAHQLVQAQTALSTLPMREQHLAVNLAEKLRNMSASLASAAEIAAENALTLQGMASRDLAKVNKSSHAADRDKLQGVAALIKMANEAAVTPIGILAAHKERVKALDEPQDDLPTTVELVAPGDNSTA